MKVINVSEIQDKKFFNYGYFSNVYKVSIDGVDYAYKEYKNIINPIVISIISELTDEEYSDNYLTPKYLIESKNNKKIIGYLSEYNSDLIELDDIYDYDKRIELLKSVKKIIEYWHKESKRIHGDINLSNILVDEKSNNSYLLDFDTSLRINTRFNKNYDIDDFPFSDYVYEYLAYYPFNEEIDVFMFNLTTIMFLSKLEFLDLMKSIRYSKLDIMNNNKDVKRLCKKMLFNNTKKSFGKEYIIDYIN